VSGDNDRQDPAGGGGTENHDRRFLERRFRQSRRELLVAWLPWIALAVILFGMAWFFAEPAPPKRVVIATGPADGAYYQFAQEYAKVFEANGLTLEVRQTAGSVENYQLLQDDASGVSVAIVQGGVAPRETKIPLQGIASLYVEPVWVFYRAELDKRPAGATGSASGSAAAGREPQLADLRGKRIAVGPEGSGTRAVALQLLAANGIVDVGAGLDTQPATAPALSPTSTPGAGKTAELLSLGGQGAADALKADKVDAAFFVISPQSPVVRSLLQPDSAGVRLMGFDRPRAYAQNFPFLTGTTLVRGVIDLQRDLPRRDVDLVAPVASLVARADLHPAVVPLLIEGATKAHERGGPLAEPGAFPSMKYLQFPVGDSAREYFASGPPFLQRYLPFWLAALLGRMKILLVPMLTLLLPLMRIAPPLYQWRVRRRIYRWYLVLGTIDRRLREPPGAGYDYARELRLLDQLEKELGEVDVPLSYMAEFYNLRLHAEYLRRRLTEARRAAGNARDEPSVLSGAGAPVSS
jgi:TRAP-type uncharacterized transport system substrate-binding protein